MTLSPDLEETAFLMTQITKPHGNPVAWARLEQRGITREMIQRVVDAGQWTGPPPDFDRYPDPEFKALILASEAKT